MIETHVLNAILDLPSREGTEYKIITFINGLVAPTFLSCGGFAFTIAVFRKWDEYLKLGKVFWRYISRLGFILVIAYTLHFPVFSLRRMISLSDEQSWMVFFQSDILQVISLTLMVSASLVVALRTKERFIWGAALCAIAIIFLSPIIREQDHSGLPIWVRPFLTMEYESQFPLFPWSAFLLGGTIVGFGYVRERERGRERIFMKRIALGAGGAIIIALAAEIIPITIYPNHDFWRASPEFFFVRFGLVTLFLCLLWVFSQNKTRPPNSPLTLFGKESLLVYVAHLLIVYGYTFEFSFVRLFGKTLPYWQCFVLTAALALGMYFLALGWSRLKELNMRLAKLLQAGVILGTAIYFILN